MHIHDSKGMNFLKAIPWVILGIAGAALLALIFGLVVMALWNWLMPEIFGLPVISYWQAWGLVLLAHILFKGPGSRHEKHDHDNDWGKDEWKQKFKEKFTSKCGEHEGFQSHYNDLQEDEDEFNE
ncbi:MAG: hypothetical protein ACLFR1_12930 [Spirochaetia bacterium]